MPIVAVPPAITGLWAGTRRRWEVAGYLAASLITLAIGPALFVAVDHAIVVEWSNAILDLVSLR